MAYTVYQLIESIENPELQMRALGIVSSGNVSNEQVLDECRNNHYASIGRMALPSELYLNELSRVRKDYYRKILSRIMGKFSDLLEGAREFDPSAIDIIHHQAPSSFDGLRTEIHRPTLVYVGQGGLEMDLDGKVLLVEGVEFPVFSLDNDAAEGYGAWNWYGRNGRSLKTNGADMQTPLLRTDVGKVRPAVEIVNWELVHGARTYDGDYTAGLLQ